MQKKKTSMVGMFVLAILVVGAGVWNQRLVAKPIDPNAPPEQPMPVTTQVDKEAERRSMKEAMGGRSPRAESTPVRRGEGGKITPAAKAPEVPTEPTIKKAPEPVATQPKVDNNRTGSQWYAEDSAMNND
jgi:hypothetical protein